MKINVVPIGNSRGIRIPKPILEQCHIGKTVDLKVEDNHILIIPQKEKDVPRKGWDKAFKKMNEKGEDKLLVNDEIGLDCGGWEW